MTGHEMITENRFLVFLTKLIYMDDDREMVERLLKIYDFIDSNDLRRNRPLPVVKSDSVYYSFKRFTNDLDCDQVFDNIFLGNVGVARSWGYLKDLGITHILNCAEGGGMQQILTTASFYDQSDIQYRGLRMNDSIHEDMKRHMEDGVSFIEDALNTPNGKVMVHCYAGVSRSASIVIAYLMLKRSFTVEDAIKQLCLHRNIYPNQGFIKQLVLLDMELQKVDSA